MTLWLPLKVSHHSTQFGGYGCYGSGDIIVLVCHVTLRDHMIKGSRDLMSGTPPW